VVSPTRALTKIVFLKLKKTAYIHIMYVYIYMWYHLREY